MRVCRSVALLAVILSAILGAQTIIGAGYTSVPRLGSAPGGRMVLSNFVAPGQVVTIFATGIKGSDAFAGGLPLPTTLAGLSVSVELNGQVQVPTIPLFSVRHLGSLTALTVQIPTEIPDLEDKGGTLVSPVLRVVGGEAFPLGGVIADSIHVVGSCWPDFCDTAVTHGDGGPVSWDRPARPGETLSVYALGLGPTSQQVSSGVAAPAGPLAVAKVFLNFEFRLNGRPSPLPLKPGPLTDPLPGQPPAFAGLVPGLVGLYQVNFQVPTEVPSGLSLCNPSTVQSNLTVTIQGRDTFDGVGICVQP